ncbi:hypothetical protein IWW50_004923 [Coemansia erecta]|nr:hypothetical protein GGF43_003285 [Coemansia sp. RSA 2618]KAJ2820766.1 hypothetical protein IWW50_004923 [Coemansia erecta]
MVSNVISGTGTGTPYPAATDVAKETGTTAFGGTELVSDPNSPSYIGHGVAHRDPKTGAPIEAHVHIPTRGDLHPEEFATTKLVDAAASTDKEMLQSKYNISNPGKYHANWYRTKSMVNEMLGKLTGSQKYQEKAAMQSSLATLELSAYNEENGGYTFAKA